MTVCTSAVAAVAAAVLSAAPALAQDSKSAPLAKQLTAALDAGKLDCIAAKDPDAPDIFVAALYFPGSLLVVSARYSVPQLLNDRLGKKEYRDVYMDLNGAAMPNTKVFIQDGAADGLKPKNADNQAADTVDTSGKETVFDGDYKKAKISEQDYQKAFADADDK